MLFVGGGGLSSGRQEGERRTQTLLEERKEGLIFLSGANSKKPLKKEPKTHIWRWTQYLPIEIFKIYKGSKYLPKGGKQ